MHDLNVSISGLQGKLLDLRGAEQMQEKSDCNSAVGSIATRARKERKEINSHATSGARRGHHL